MIPIAPPNYDLFVLDFGLFVIVADARKRESPHLHCRVFLADTLNQVHHEARLNRVAQGWRAMFLSLDIVENIRSEARVFVVRTVSFAGVRK